MSTTLTVPAAELIDAVKVASIATTKPRDGLPILECLALTATPGKHWALVSTDRYRMVEYRLSAPAPEEAGTWLLPVAEVKQVKIDAKGESVTIAVEQEGERVVFGQDGEIGSVLLFPGSFPAVERLWPDAATLDQRVTLERRDLKVAAQAAAKTGDKRRRGGVPLTLAAAASDSLQVTATEADDSTRDVALLGATVDGWQYAAFDVRFLADLMLTGRGAVTIAGWAPNKPFVITHEDRPSLRILLMPVRLAEPPRPAHVAPAEAAPAAPVETPAADATAEAPAAKRLAPPERKTWNRTLTALAREAGRYGDVIAHWSQVQALRLSGFSPADALATLPA